MEEFRLKEAHASTGHHRGNQRSAGIKNDQPGKEAVQFGQCSLSFTSSQRTEPLA